MNWKGDILEWLEQFIDDATELEFYGDVVELKVNDELKAILVLQKL